MEKMRDVLRHQLGRSLAGLSVLDRVEAAWPVACGRALAGRGKVVAVEDGIVEIDAEDELWLAQMISMRSALLGDLARVSGVRLTGIHFKSSHSRKGRRP